MLPRTGLAAVSAALLAMNRRLEVRDVLQTITTSARELLDAGYATQAALWAVRHGMAD